MTAATPPPSDPPSSSATSALGDPTTIVTALGSLRGALDAAELTLDLPDVAPGRAARVELRDQIDDYLIPRLQRLDAPLLAVLGGSTGSGKSTITNTIAGAPVSPSGVLRPTTRAPVLLCHPDDAAWFTGADLLPELARHTGDGTPTGAVLKIVPVDTMTPGLAIIDAPDIDSIESANRDLATQLLAAADLWLFVTTAVRYADAVPWEFLERAQARGTQLSVVINRVPEGAADQIVPHLAEMLEGRGLHDVRLFAFDEIDPGDVVDSALPAGSVDPLADHLDGLASDAEARAEVVRSTLQGALASVEGRAQTVLAALRAQDATAGELRASLERTYDEARAAIADDLSGGTLLRAEVLDRWQELIGTAELMRALQSRISRLRDRLGSFLRGRTAQAASVQGEITSTLEQLLVDHADAAALRTVQRWQALPGGSQVLRDADGQIPQRLERMAPEVRSELPREITAWQDELLSLVGERGAGKRSVARVLAFGVNSVGVALMIVVFSQTGGLTGGEVAVASGTAAVSQTLLTALFGEQAVRDLATKARQLLSDRIERLLDTDANRFRSRLWSTVTPPETADTLESAIADWRRAQP